LAVYHVSDVVQDGGKGRTVSLRGGFRASGFAPKTSCRVEMAARFVIRACRVAGGGVGTKREEKMSEFHSSAVGWVVRARKRGVTLIEAVLFISIALGIIVGGLVFFQQASLAQRTSDAVRTISSISSETRAMYQTETDFAGVAPAVLIAAGAVPSNIVNADGATLQNEWGGVADLSAYSDRWRAEWEHQRASQQRSVRDRIHGHPAGGLCAPRHRRRGRDQPDRLGDHRCRHFRPGWHTSGDGRRQRRLGTG
jgi:hypothetical protein